MDLSTFILAERVTGTVSAVDTNPTEPPRPGVQHYLATMHRDGRTFTTHCSAPIGETPGLAEALRTAAERARRTEMSATYDNWLRATGLSDDSGDAEAAGPGHVAETELWHRAQEAEAQALRAFLGEGGYRRLIEALPPPPPAEAAPASRSRRRRRWLLGALGGTVMLAAPILLARSGTRGRRRRRSLRRLLPA